MSKRWRSEKYLNWIRQQPCMNCGNSTSEPHHIKGFGNFSGAGLKAPDFLTMPLCGNCHRLIHLFWFNNDVFPSDIQSEWALKTITKAVEQGILTVKI